MGFLNKIMFWKKKDDDLGDLGLGGKDNLAFGNDFNPSPGFGQNQGFGQVGPGQGSGMGSDYGQGLGQGQGVGSRYPQPSFGSPQYPQYQQGYDPQDEIRSKSIEVISSKLDALRASLDSINQRLENIEAIARGDEESSRRKRYY